MFYSILASLLSAAILSNVVLQGIGLEVLNNKELIDLPASTAFGALSKYITSADVNNFNPMNVNFGIFDALGYDTKKKDRKEEYVNRALKIINETKKKYLND